MASSSSSNDRVDQTILLAEDLIQRCYTQHTVKGNTKLARKIQAELKFLKTLKDKDAKGVEMHLNSSNLVHLEAVVKAAETLPGVCNVNKTFHLHGSKADICVDIVCNHGYTWTKVVARKPKALHLTWAGGGQFGERSIVQQANQYQKCAHKHPKNFRAPQVVFIFVQGITIPLKEAVEKTGVLVQGDIVELEADGGVLVDLNCSRSEDELAQSETLHHFGVSHTLLLQPQDEEYHHDYYSSSSDSEAELLSASEMVSKLKIKQDKSATKCSHCDKRVISCIPSEGAADAAYRSADDVDGKTTLSSFQEKSSLQIIQCKGQVISRDPSLCDDEQMRSLKQDGEKRGEEVEVARVKSEKTKGKETITHLKQACCEMSFNSDEVMCDKPDDYSSSNCVIGGALSIYVQQQGDKVDDETGVNKNYLANCDNCCEGSDSGFIAATDVKYASTLTTTTSSDERGNYRFSCTKSTTGSGCNSSSAITTSLLYNAFFNNDRITPLKHSRCDGIPDPRSTNYVEGDTTTCTTALLRNDSLSEDSDGEGIKPGVATTTVPELATAAGSEFVLYCVPEIWKVNLDITTLISYVSNLTHGLCNYLFEEPILTQQAAEERQKALLPELEELFTGKQLLACETAVHDFRAILHTVGGPSEKQRAEEFLDRIQIVPDCPSERVNCLKRSAKIKDRAKVVFGTGDTLKVVTVKANSGFVRASHEQGVGCVPALSSLANRTETAITESSTHSAVIFGTGDISEAVTVTANTGFVRAASQRHIDLAVYLHPSRALTERKQATAKLLATH